LHWVSHFATNKLFNTIKLVYQPIQNENEKLARNLARWISHDKGEK